jgi:hypothetical protein
MATVGGPMLLSTPTGTPTIVTDYLAAVGSPPVTLFGGTSAVASPG